MSLIKDLCCLLCKFKCQPSAVASLLTFHPPHPPYYYLDDGQVNDAGNKETVVHVNPIASQRTFDGVKIHIIKTRLGELIPGFLFQYPGAKYTLIHSHGNAADCGTMYDHYISLCTRLRINVFGYDYTGYGCATGVPSEAATYADIEAVYDFVVESGICPDPEEHLVIYGQSVGSGPSCRLASSRKRPIRAMILHSPIMSGLRVMMDNRGPLFCCDIYPNISRIKNVKCPVVIIHGELDDQVALKHGQSLHEKVPARHQTPPLWIDGADHNDIVERFGEQYFRRLEELFDFLRDQDAQDPTGASSREVATT